MINFDNFRKAQIPTEEEVMVGWKAEYHEPLVSVICTAFNQELYIEDAIRGFLMQKTNFPFEIIIHDDASTDATAEIIKEYADKYPKIIKTIFQLKNQYSQAPNSVFLIAIDYSKGAYLALCEGDDFWIVNNKLQKQKEMMDANPDCSIVVHNAYKLYNNGTSDIFRKITEDFIFSPGDILDLFVQFAPTASYFIERAVVDKLPIWFKSAPIADLFIELYSLKIGKGIYICEPYAAYRVGAVNSWSVRTSANRDSRIKSNLKFISYFDKLILDFSDFEDRINYRKALCYKSLAYEICNNNIYKSLLKSNVLAYKEIRSKVKLLQCFNLLKFNIYFPFTLFFFILFQIVKIIWLRGKSALNYFYRFAKRGYMIVKIYH